MQRGKAIKPPPGTAKGSRSRAELGATSACRDASRAGSPGPPYWTGVRDGQVATKCFSPPPLFQVAIFIAIVLFSVHHDESCVLGTKLELSPQSQAQGGLLT